MSIFLKYHIPSCLISRKKRPWPVNWTAAQSWLAFSWRFITTRRHELWPPAVAQFEWKHWLKNPLTHLVWEGENNVNNGDLYGKYLLHRIGNKWDGRNDIKNWTEKPIWRIKNVANKTSKQLQRKGLTKGRPSVFFRGVIMSSSGGKNWVFVEVLRFYEF